MRVDVAQLVKAFGAFFLVLAVAPPALATDVPGGTISSSVTWTLAGSPYVVLGNVTVQSGSVLTIEPGVDVRFAGNYSLTIGGTSASSQGTLLAVGTAPEPITFQFDGTPGPGKWAYVRFQIGSTSSSIMEHCRVLHAGSSLGAISCSSSSPSLSNVTVEDSATDAIHLASSSPSFSGAIGLVGSGGYLIRATTTGSQPTFAGVTLSSSGNLAIGGAKLWSNFFDSGPALAGGPYRAELMTDTVAASSTWGGVPGLASIDLLGDLTIQGAAHPVLTLAAGTVLRLPPTATSSGNVYVGGTSASTRGDLVAAGTAQDPVRFERFGASAWRYVHFRIGSTSASSLTHCRLVGGGSSLGAIYCTSSSPSLSNVTVQDSATDGIYLASSSPSLFGEIDLVGSDGYLIRATNSGSQPTFSGVTLSSSDKLAIGGAKLWSNFFDSGPALAGGPYRAELMTDTVAASSTWGGVPGLASIDLLGDLTIQGAAHPVLTLAAGTVLRLPPAATSSGTVFVGGTSVSTRGDFVAAGTAQDPVRFERSGEGAWRYVYFRIGSTSASSLTHCRLVGGGSSFGAIYCNPSSPSLSNVTVEGSATDAIYLANSSPGFSGEIGLVGSDGYLIRATTTGSQPTFAGVTLSSSGKLAIGGAKLWSHFFNSGPALSGGPYRAELLNDTVAASSTWGGVPGLASIDLLGDLTIQGAAHPVLTLAAGTVLRLPPAATSSGTVYVGGTSVSTRGDLVAAGTAQDPVRFERSGEGAWRYVYFRIGSTSASSLTHCRLVGGGSSFGAIYCNASSPSLSNVTVEGSATDAIYLANSSPGFFGEIGLVGSGGYLIRATNSGSQPTFSGVTLSSSGKLAIGGAKLWSHFFDSGPALAGGPYRAEVLADTLTASSTWGGIANLASIDLLGLLTVAHSSAPTLTIAPGTAVRLSGQDLDVGTSTSPGALVASGTAEAPILFTSSSASPAPGQWNGIDIGSAAGPCLLEHCTVEYAGGGTNGAGLRIANARTVVRHCTFDQSSAAGVKITGGSPVLELSRFTGNLYGVDALASTSPATVFRNNELAGNTVNGLRSASSSGLSAELNTWGEASGPSGIGAGSGDSISGNVLFEPWLESAPAPGFEWVHAFQNPDPFSQQGGATSFYATWNEAAAWTLEIRDAASVLVRSFSGTGSVIAQPWEGDDDSGSGGAPGAPLPDGAYTYSLSAASLASSAPAPVARGVVTLDGSLPVARITSPDPYEMVAGAVEVRGSAAGSGFTSYQLAYRAGVSPGGTTWTTIASGSSPIADGVLGTWNASALTGPIYTLRLTVSATGGATAEDLRVVRVLSTTALIASPAYISPDGDSVQDGTTLSSSLTWPVDWTLTISETGGGPTARTFAGTGDAVAVHWDGTDETATVVPDGSYEASLVATASGSSAAATSATVVVVDVTAPSALISSPTEEQTVLSFAPFQIEGTAADANFLTYTLSIAAGSPPGAFTQLRNSNTAVSGIPPDDDLFLLATMQYPPGTYTLRLRVADRAGNVSTTDRVFTLDYVQITAVASQPLVIDPVLGQEVEVSFTLSHACDVDVDFHQWPSRALVRRVAAASLPAGASSVFWDGLDGTGTYSTPDLLHYYVIYATDSLGREGRFNHPTSPTMGTGASWGATSVVTSGFDPYANDEIRVVYNVNGWLSSQITVQGSNLSVPLNPTGTFHPGAHVDYWDGRNQLGALHSGNFHFFFGVPGNLPSPAVFLQRGPIRFLELRAQPYLIHPLFGQVSGLAYELTRDAYVSIAVEDPNGSHVRTILPGAFQTAGTYGLDAGLAWDGRDDQEQLVAVEGTYTVVLSAIDLVTQEVYERRGAVTVYR